MALMDQPVKSNIHVLRIDIAGWLQCVAETIFIRVFMTGDSSAHKQRFWSLKLGLAVVYPIIYPGIYFA